MEELYLQPQPARPGAAPSFARETIDAVEFILEEDIFALEGRLARYVGAPFCVAVSDAASGIALSLRAAGIGSGDKVLLAALGCAVPVQGIALAGATPVFVDINPNTYTLDPFCIEYVLGKLARQGEFPKALIAADLFGAPCHYRELTRICDQHGLVLIEDLSDALSATLSGIMTGNFGRFSVASFAPGNLEELGGGAVFCRCEDDAFRLASLRHAAKQEFLGERGGALPCMGSADASVISEQLKLCSDEAAGRRKVATRYREKLAGAVQLQQMVPDAESSYSQLVVTLPRARDRKAVAEVLKQRHVPAAGPGRGRQTGYCEWNRRMLPCALSLNDRLLSLPINPHMSEHIVDYICESLFEALDS